MTLFLISVALLALARAHPDQARGLRGERAGKGNGGGRGGERGDGRDKRSFLQAKVDEQCPSLQCPADKSSIDCDIDRPERPDIDWADLTKGDKAALKDEKEAKMGDYVSALALCVCCTDTPLEDVLPDKERRSRGQKLFGEGKGRDKGSGGRGGGRGGGPGGRGGGPGRRGDGKGKRDFLQAKVDEKCESETLQCPADESSIDCDIDRPERPDIDWANLTEQEKADLKDGKEAAIGAYVDALALCVCCTDVPLEDVLPDREDLIEERCGELECPADPAALDCDFEKPARSKADWSNLTEGEKAALKEEQEGKRGFREQLALCVCCAEDFALGDVFPTGPKGRPGKFGGKFGGKL